jgi:tetratricopeptide (TPR) repeat protein
MRITYIRMRRMLLIPVLLAVLSAAPPALTQQVDTAAPEVMADDPLTSLFEALKRERDPETARGLAQQVMTELASSGSPTVDLLMQWANTAIAEKRNAAALDFLDQATLLQPNFAEAWNRRAGLHYAMGDKRKSMADIHQVLLREPRHFGAIAGLAAILSDNGQDEQALRAWEQYLEIYPADREAQQATMSLSEKLAGSRT